MLHASASSLDYCFAWAPRIRVYLVVLFKGGEEEEEEAADVDVEDFDSLFDDDPEAEASVVSCFVQATVRRKNGRGKKD